MPALGVITYDCIGRPSLLSGYVDGARFNLLYLASSSVILLLTATLSAVPKAGLIITSRIIPASQYSIRESCAITFKTCSYVSKAVLSTCSARIICPPGPATTERSFFPNTTDRKVVSLNVVLVALLNIYPIIVIY